MSCELFDVLDWSPYKRYIQIYISFMYTYKYKQYMYLFNINNVWLGEIDIIIARGKRFIIIKFYSKIAYLFVRMTFSIAIISGLIMICNNIKWIFMKVCTNK